MATSAGSLAKGGLLERCAPMLDSKLMRTPRKVNGGRSQRHHLNAPSTRKTTEKSKLLRRNKKCARNSWGSLSKNSLQTLTELTLTHSLSVSAGHLQLLDGHWYITHSGLLRVALRNRCLGINTTLQERVPDPGANRWVFKATVYKSSRSLMGCSWFAWREPFTAGIDRSLFWRFASSSWHQNRSSPERSRDDCIAPNGHNGNSTGFSATSATTMSYSIGTKWTKRPSASSAESFKRRTQF
jgi:hypothetical protein